MKKCKKYLSLILTVILLLSMVGCGTQKEEAKKFEPKLDTNKKVELDVTGFFGNFEALDQVLNDFNQYYPNVTINYAQVGGDYIVDYLKSSPKTDIFMASSENLKNQKQDILDMVVDLKKAGVDVSDLEEDMLSSRYINGKLVSLPIGKNMYGMVVNVSLLEKEGLSVPQTYDEFLTVLAKLKKKGYTPIQSAESKGYAELTLNMLLDEVLSNADLLEELKNGDKKAVDTLLPIYDKLDELIKEGYIDSKVNQNYPDDNYDQAILNFFEGNVPFWICNTEKASGMKKRESKSEAFTKSPFEYTYTYVPLGEKGVYAYSEPWYGFCVNKKAKKLDYAIEFMRFLATKDESNQMARVKGVPSIAKGKQESELYKNVLKPEKVQQTCVNKGEVPYTICIAWYSCTNAYVKKEFKTSRQALETFVKDCQKELN